LRNQTNGHGVFFDSPFGFVGENPFPTAGEELSEGENVLFPVEYRFVGEDVRVVQLNSVDNLKDTAFGHDLRSDICENPGNECPRSTQIRKRVRHPLTDWMVMRAQSGRIEVGRLTIVLIHRPPHAIQRDSEQVYIGSSSPPLGATLWYPRIATPWGSSPASRMV